MTRPSGELCRITVVAAESQADVAVPGTMSIGEVLPTLIRSLDPAVANRASPPHGWILQRLGEEPLDEDGTFDALGLCDGDMVYVRPREDPLPPIVFDDLVDGVATAIKQRPDLWLPAMTRRLFIGLAGVLIGLIWVGLLLAGPAAARTVVAGLLSLALVSGGAVSSRAMGEQTFGFMLGVAAVPFAALGGWLLVTLADQKAIAQAAHGAVFGLAVGPATGSNVLAAGAFAAVVALMGLVLIGLRTWVSLALVVTAMCVGLGGLLSAWLHLDAARSAGVVSVLAFALGVFAPTWATRLVRMRLPQLPSDEEELQEDIEPTPGREVLGLSARADGYLNALCIAAGLLCSGSMVLLARGHGWASPVLVAVVSAAMLLRSRMLLSCWQRMAAVVPGAVGFAALLLGAVHLAEPAVRPFALLGVSMLTGALLFGANYLPNRRLLPFWGRAADILETATGLMSVPILLQVLQVYGWARGFAG